MWRAIWLRPMVERLGTAFAIAGDGPLATRPPNPAREPGTIDSAAWTGRQPIPWWGRWWGWNRLHAFYDPGGDFLFLQVWRITIVLHHGRFFGWMLPDAVWQMVGDPRPRHRL